MYRVAMREAKPVLAIVLAAAALVALAPEADARPRPAGRHKSNFQANKTFGLGIMLGAPTGLSGKYFLGPSTAIDFGIGAIGGYGRRDGLHLHADYLWHPLSLVSAEPFELPLYFGIGGRFWSYDYCHDHGGGHCHDGGALGVRAPIGIAFDFNNVPLDIFVELALVLDFLYDDHDHFDDGDDFDGFDAEINGAFGIRYYFN